MKISDIRFQYGLKNNTPGDPSGLLTPRATPGMIWASAKPRVSSAPELLLSSQSCEELLGLSALSSDAELAARVLTGSELLPGSSPYSTRYGGHQFGHWADQLGDGRAISLGHLEANNSLYEIQLKGAGGSAYSRRADGLAVLRSSLREFLCSEAMHFLGVPTTRALSLCLTGDQVMRDMFYDGNPEWEPGAVVARVAPSFLRFGHFQILSAHSEKKPFDSLIRYTLSTYFGHLRQDDLTEWALNFYREVCQETAVLMTHWMRVGFVHGVMNTDNMSIHSLTIDYGPYGWMDNYDPNWTPNTTDFESRRYRYGAQPAVAAWNLARLGESLMAHFGASDKWSEAYGRYSEVFNKEIAATFGRKLGLFSASSEEVMKLVGELEAVFSSAQIDYTIFYRELSRQKFQTSLLEGNLDPQKIVSHLEEALYFAPLAASSENLLLSWLLRYQNLVLRENKTSNERSEIMLKTNPFFILRNYLVQSALDEYAKGSRVGMQELLLALKTPYEENDFTAKFYQRRPEWARNRPGCSTLSCSS